MRWLVAVILAVILGPWAWRSAPALGSGACENPASAVQACACCVTTPAPEPDACCGPEAQADPKPAPALTLTSCPTCRCGPAPARPASHSNHQTSPDAPSRAPAPNALCLIDLSPGPAPWDAPAMVPPLDAQTRRALLNVRTT